MAGELDLTSFNVPDDWDECFSNLDFISVEDIFGPQIALEVVLPSDPPGFIYQYGFLATQEVTPDSSLAPHSICSWSSSQSQIVTPADNTQGTHAICSESTSVPPSPPVLEYAVFYPPKWLKIPQDTYSQRQWDFRVSAPILFQVNGYPGINLGHAFDKKIAALEGWDDLVLQDAKGAISCRLLFPGYPLNDYPQISTRYWNKQRDPITRGKLAHEVARKVKQHLDTMNTSHVMDASIDAQWRIGSHGFMRLENMFLARLVSVSRGSYQPEIWVMDSMM